LPATVPAAEAELAALSTIVVTAVFRRYQITRRRIARGLVLLLRGSGAWEESGSFGSNGVDDALEQIAGTASREDQLRVSRIIFQFGTKPGDMNINHTSINVALWGVAPHFLEDFATVKRFS
jgi:hypothetical protein